MIREMQIWVDADACPGAIKEILYRAAERVGVELTLVANHALTTPPSRFIKSIRVDKGFDVADEHITGLVERGDIVITADIPLAAEVVEKGAIAINPRGDLYTAENVRERLNDRDMMAELRTLGLVSGGPPPPGKRERQAFANQLDRLLAGLISRRQRPD